MRIRWGHAISKPYKNYDRGSYFLGTLWTPTTWYPTTNLSHILSLFVSRWVVGYQEVGVLRVPRIIDIQA